MPLAKGRNAWVKSAYMLGGVGVPHMASYADFGAVLGDSLPVGRSTWVLVVARADA